jgi:hypothetical protein
MQNAESFLAARSGFVSAFIILLSAFTSSPSGLRARG